MTIVKWEQPLQRAAKSNAGVFKSPFSGLLDDFFGEHFFRHDQAAFMPAVNVSQTESEYLVELSAPGFEKEDFKIGLDKDALSVSAEHASEQETKDKTYHRKEFVKGSFKRTFTLPEEVDEAGIQAKYENGILKISLPKKELPAKASREISVS